MTATKQAGHVKISGGVESAVSGTVQCLLYDAGVTGGLSDMALQELSERITAATLFTYNSVQAQEPAAEFVSGVTGCTLEAALRDRIELLINRLTYDDGTWSDQDVFHLESEFVEQIFARLKSRGYPIDPKNVCVLYDKDGKAVATVDVSVGYSLLLVRPSIFEERVKAALEEFQGRY